MKIEKHFEVFILFLFVFSFFLFCLFAFLTLVYFARNLNPLVCFCFVFLSLSPRWVIVTGGLLGRSRIEEPAEYVVCRQQRRSLLDDDINPHQPH